MLRSQERREKFERMMKQLGLKPQPIDPETEKRLDEAITKMYRDTRVSWWTLHKRCRSTG